MSQKEFKAAVQKWHDTAVENKIKKKLADSTLFAFLTAPDLQSRPDRNILGPAIEKTGLKKWRFRSAAICSLKFSQNIL